MAEWWSADLLDLSDAPVGSLPGVRGGRLEWSIFRAVWGLGTLYWTEPADASIDWLSSRVQIWHHRGDQRRSMGVWIPAVPAYETDGTGRRAEITLLDKTEVLNQRLGVFSPVRAGTNVVGHVRTILEARGETKIAITASAATLPRDLWFDPDDTWLHVCNTILDAIGYGALHVDMHGAWTAAPYVEPDRRPVVATYGGAVGDERVISSWRDEAPIFDVPNVVRLSVRGDENTVGMRAVARNSNPADPLSIPRRGREITHTETVEAADQAALNVMAQRRLGEVSQVTRRVPIRHAVDGTRINDVVRFRPLDLTGPVVERRIDLGVGAVVEDTIRRIYTGGDLW